MRRDLIAGVVVLAVIILALSLFAGGGDNGVALEGEPCTIGPASVRVPLSVETFDRGDERLRSMAEAAADSDYDAVFQAFYPFTHALTHDVDARLRLESEEALANELCQAVVALEFDIVVPEKDFERLERWAQEIRMLLDRARAELGFAP